MSDIIKLLPESIANQIAAGEVIQRPASVVKELMENSVDAQSASITLVIKNSGKTLIQVIDDGMGMSETDARMSFERHATSKIRSSEDLFRIDTKGFRGEALASIASIAEVEMKTRRQDSELGTHLIIRSSKVVSQDFCQANTGTSLSVKNLFFNVPARRKFLKSDATEYKYIVEEFHRIALSHPELSFRLIHNDNEVYNLPKSNLKRRVLGIFRKTYEDKLIKIDEEASSIKIHGFIGQPEISKRQNGEQYIFVNKRFIKSNYLNHAIRGAYQNLVEEKAYPFFVLFLDLDPASIDINVHPTKHEIKFNDERLIYNFLKVAVKHGLGRYVLSPTLDFDNDEGKIISRPFPSKEDSSIGTPLASRTRTAPALRNWQNLYTDTKAFDLDSEEAENKDEQPLIIPSAASGNILEENTLLDNEEKTPFQIHNSYILVPIKSGFLILDQHVAHARILYEKYLNNLNNKKELIQKQLFPLTINIGKDKIAVLEEVIPDIRSLGFEIENFGGQTFIVHGTPAGFHENDIQGVIDGLVDQYISNIGMKLSKNENLARSMAFSAAINKGKLLTTEEMTALIDDLFACEFPYKGPSGRKCFITYELATLEKMFN